MNIRGSLLLFRKKYGTIKHIDKRSGGEAPGEKSKSPAWCCKPASYAASAVCFQSIYSDARMRGYAIQSRLVRYIPDTQQRPSPRPVSRAFFISGIVPVQTGIAHPPSTYNYTTLIYLLINGWSYPRDRAPEVPSFRYSDLLSSFWGGVPPLSRGGSSRSARGSDLGLVPKMCGRRYY